jgi:oxygen-independent coproporphyrinogen-3 oxidase
MKTNMAGKIRELELYIHIPFCKRKCAYCDFLSFALDAKEQELYMQALFREIRAVSKRYKDRLVTTVFIGGGTPSCIAYEMIERLMDVLSDCFRFAPEAEVSMEANPGTIQKESVSAYRRAGINRISIGLQSANDKELQTLGRIHTWRDFLAGYDLLRKAGFDNLNIDLMSALPGQSVRSYEQTLKSVCALKPEHISAYSLIIEEGTPFYDSYYEDSLRQADGEKTAWLPDEEQMRAIDILTREYLAGCGYLRYEISNYAKPGRECKHNIGYWKRKDYLGFGLGASSLVDEMRFSNTRDLKKYLQMAQTQEFVYETFDILTKKEQMEEFMFLGLRMCEGISRERFARKFGVEIEGIYADVLAKYRKMDLLYASKGRIALTEEGMDVSNVILADFLLT